MSAERLYLLDVEGTIAPLSLTSEQLFPYARMHFETFLKQSVGKLPLNLDESAEGSVSQDLLMLLVENRRETDPDVPRILPDVSRSSEVIKGDAIGFFIGASNTIPRILKYIFWLMDRDRKSTALKSLQGKVWKAGFESGELKGTLFPDVPAAFERWSARGKVAIYSSGSVEAQKLLFRYAIYGDLSRLVSGYFDTRTGPKMSAASYAAIATAMDVDPADALFFSDVVRELDAAREAGFQTRLIVREGNVPVEDARGHESIASLDAVL
jgi:enolase-phosphatase E1